MWFKKMSRYFYQQVGISRTMMTHKVDRQDHFADPLCCILRKRDRLNIELSKINNLLIGIARMPFQLNTIYLDFNIA